MSTQLEKKLIQRLKNLPNNYWDFKNSDTKEYTHGIHNYPATMICPISRNIIKLVKEIRTVHALFDPFAGSGTVLVEGMLSGIETIAGNDINPLALLLSKVKTTPLQICQLENESKKLLQRISMRTIKLSDVLQSIDHYIINILEVDITEKGSWGNNASTYLEEFCCTRKLAVDIPSFKNLGYWFRPRIIIELSIIKSEIERIEDHDIRNFIFIALSETIRLVSNRRNGEFKMFRMPVDKVKTFNPCAYTEFKKILHRNISKMQDFWKALTKINCPHNVSIFRNNSCSLEDVPCNTYDLIITSPPYGDSRTTVAYGEFSRLSLQWINIFDLTDKEIMGLDKSLMGGRKYRNGFELNLESPTLNKSLDRIKEVDIERAGDVYSFYEDLNTSLKGISEKTRSGGYHFWVVGNRTVKKELLKTDIIIAELAQQHGLTPIFTIARNIPNKVMPLQNSPSNISGETASTMTLEHIVILRKA